MGKLHELLSVEDDLRQKATRSLSTLRDQFQNKQNRYVSQTVMFRPKAEGEEDRLEGKLDLTETTLYALENTVCDIANYIDAFFQKESTNTEAKSDIILPDGTVFYKDVPATALLALEKEIGRLEDIYSNLPELEPGIDWKICEENPSMRKHVQVKIRTKKVTKPLVLYDATDRHPAQVREITEDIPTGEVVTTLMSSKLTPEQKASMLKRLSVLKQSIKKARMRANEEPVKNLEIGQKIFSYINDGVSF